ncbi:MAG: hypothetical protein GYB20_05725 [Oceanospirillales bacterium]|nr:hypothetical protein [Oceanospirillales bacterium]MBR9887179.1 hypothetical protein [Oceanospirillales bacterium]
MFEHTDKDNPHFHMIIQDPRGDLENRYSFDEVLRSVIPKLKPKHATHSNLDNRRLISNDSWCLQEYYNNGNYDLEKYLSKEFNRNEGAAKAHLDNFSTINVDGVEFGLRYEKVYPEIRILTAQ